MAEESENISFWKLVRTRNFGLFWGAGALSGIGDHFDSYFRDREQVLRAMWAAVGVAFFVGIIGAYVDVLLLTWLQRRTPQAMMGRVMSLMLIAEVGLPPISIAVAGGLIKLSLEWVFVGAGTMIALFCLFVGFRREIRGMRMTEDSDT